MLQTSLILRYDKLNIINTVFIKNIKIPSLHNRNASTKRIKKTASSVYKVMNIFDRKSKEIQREASAKRKDYNMYEYIKEEVGWRTADRVFDIKRIFNNAVELGN